tara:strand:+ start:1906 stop:3114 length:1209 start_codon:yes stop_codon:yes gene_type:complete
MISEDRVRSFLELLPVQSWLRQYVCTASKLTTSPAAYHIACGLATLSASAPSNIGIQFAAWPVRANFYTVLVGRSGDDQKSTATHIARSVINMAIPVVMQPNPVSPEGLEESIGQQNKQTLIYSEFGYFLTQTKQGYGEGLKTKITDLWDCTPIGRRKSKSEDTLVVKDPRLSIMGACAMPFLSEHTNAEDWSGGFLGRWFFIHAQRERVDSFPNRGKKTEGLEKLANQLKSKFQTGNYFCAGLDTEAFEMWDLWYKNLDSRKMPKIITGLKSRAPTHALRIILLLAFDLGYTRQYDWIIDTHLVSLAIEITEMYIDSLCSISENLEPDEESRLRKKILEYLKECGGIGSLGNFIRQYRTPVAITKTAIEWLCVAGYIQKFEATSTTKSEGDRFDIVMKLIE